MKAFATASLLALSLIVNAGIGRADVFEDLKLSAPRSVFEDLSATAPRSIFDEIRDTAPKSIWDQLNDAAPRPDGAFGGVQQTARRARTAQ